MCVVNLLDQISVQRAIHDQGLSTVLRQLHDELDAAVAAVLRPSALLSHALNPPPTSRTLEIRTQVLTHESTNALPHTIAPLNIMPRWLMRPHDKTTANRSHTA